MRKFNDLTHNVYGNWTVISRAENVGIQSRWVCRCSCQNHTEKIVYGCSLTSGKSMSCGCKRIGTTYETNRELREEIDLTGKTFGKWKVIKKGNDKNNQPTWLCECNCERGTLREVYRSSLVNGLSTSCGCTRDKHRTANMRIYGAWANIKARCLLVKNEAYKNYGGRGINICLEWLEDYFSFENWALENGYKENLTIDRIDVDGNYEPNNCRWVTMKEQNLNKRNNVYIEFDGERLTCSQWAKKMGIKQSILCYHNNKGDIQEYLTKRKIKLSKQIIK